MGGASPNSIAVGKQLAYITNATNDNISVIDYRTQKIVKHIPIKVSPLLDKYRGLLPFGITLSKDEKKLYVALLGFNAVAVVDIASEKTLGLIPTGWGPSRVMLGKQDKEIYIITARGLGAGPNGGIGYKKPVQGTFVSDLQLGSFHKVPVPDSVQLAKYTATTLSNTFAQRQVEINQNPLPPLPGVYQSPIKYIVYITKENRTYDEVFGQIKEAKGDGSLARFGLDNAYTLLPNQRERFKGLRVTPNHHKIARQFAFSDLLLS